MKKETESCAARKVMSFSTSNDCGTCPQICHMKLLLKSSLVSFLSSIEFNLLEICVLEDVSILQIMSIVLPNPIFEIGVQERFSLRLHHRHNLLIFTLVRFPSLRARRCHFHITIGSLYFKIGVVRHRLVAGRRLSLFCLSRFLQLRHRRARRERRWTFALISLLPAAFARAPLIKQHVGRVCLLEAEVQILFCH